MQDSPRRPIRKRNRHPEPEKHLSGSRRTAQNRFPCQQNVPSLPLQLAGPSRRRARRPLSGSRAEELGSDHGADVQPGEKPNAPKGNETGYRAGENHGRELHRPRIYLERAAQVPRTLPERYGIGPAKGETRRRAPREADGERTPGKPAALWSEELKTVPYRLPDSKPGAGVAEDGARRVDRRRRRFESSLQQPLTARQTYRILKPSFRPKPPSKDTQRPFSLSLPRTPNSIMPPGESRARALQTNHPSAGTRLHGN